MIRLLKVCAVCRGDLGRREYGGPAPVADVRHDYPEAQPLEATMLRLAGASRAEAQASAGGDDLWMVSLAPPLEHTCPAWARRRGERAHAQA